MSCKREEYEVYYTGSSDNKYHGVGIVTRKDFQAEFDKVTDGICVATIKLEREKRDLKFISAYAPTLETCEKNEDISEEFY